MSDILNACLCELNISTWTARKLDKNVSREVKQSKGAHSDEAARVNKYLMAGMNNLKEITDYVALVRAEFYRKTLPWSDSGQRLVPMAQFFDLKQWINESEAEFNKKVSQFLTDYPNLISAQAFQLGAMFDRSDYPSVEDIANRFRFRVVFLPLPTAGDFRVDAPIEIVASMKRTYDTMYKERVAEAQRDLWNRVYETLKHMSDRLGYDSNGKKVVFRDSLVENALELCELLGTLNVTGDKDLEKARSWLESMLLGVTPEDLRETGARDDVKAQVDNALDAWF
jgi:hypothetical protein